MPIYDGQSQDIVAATEWTIPQARKIIAQVEWRQPDGLSKDMLVQIEWRQPDGRAQDILAQFDWNTIPQLSGELSAGVSTIDGEHVSGNTVQGEVPHV